MEKIIYRWLVYRFFQFGGASGEQSPLQSANERLFSASAADGNIQWCRKKWKWGHPSGAKRRNFFFLIVPLHFFGSKSTISRFGERFRYSQYSLVSFLFAVRLLTVPACPTESAPMAISLRPTPCILGELLARTQKFVLIYAENFPNDFHSDSSNGGTLRLLCDHLVDPRNLRCAFQSQVVCFQPTHLWLVDRQFFSWW